MLDKPSSESYAFCGAGKIVKCLRPIVLGFRAFDSPPFVGKRQFITVLSYESVPLAKATRFFKVSLLASAQMLLLDHPEDVRDLPKRVSKEEGLQRLRRLLAVRLVNDICGPVVEWASPV